MGEKIVGSRKRQVLSSRCYVLGATLVVRDWLVFNEPKRERCLSLFCDATYDVRILAALSLTSDTGSDATNGLRTDG